MVTSQLGWALQRQELYGIALVVYTTSIGSALSMVVKNGLFPHCEYAAGEVTGLSIVDSPNTSCRVAVVVRPTR
jgi:hypothetical protein